MRGTSIFCIGHKPDPIIFRDMKPSNVMVNLQDHIVLVDFGIAKAVPGWTKRDNDRN